MAGHERYTPRGLGNLGKMTPTEDECVTVPDPSTLHILPWDRRFAHMTADLYFGGTEPFAHCTRSILKRQIEVAAHAGYELQLGIEPELYVVQPFQEARLGSSQVAEELAPYKPSGRLRPTAAYDVEATLDMMDFMRPMVRAMKECGFGAFSFDHEGGDGQVEFDFDFAPSLVTADRLTLFRLMAKQIAKQCGLMVTFMPKPYTDAWGSGAHFNMSLTDPESGQNLFRDPEDTSRPGLEQDGLQLRRRNHAACAGTGRHLHPDRQLLQATASHGCPTEPCHGRRRGPPTGITTARACSASPATGPRSRIARWTRRPTLTWPRPSSWPRVSRGCPKGWTRVSPSRI